MTTQDDKKKITELLYSNTKYSEVSFDKLDFTPTNRGHGLYIQTLGNDILIDLRLAEKRPFWGHTHPIHVQHNLGNLNNKLVLNHYSVPRTEFHRMVETFQRVHFSDVLKSDFKITYYNIVIDIDEKILDYDIDFVKKQLKEMINKNPETLFWIVENDIILLNSSFLHFLEWDDNQTIPSNVHQCLYFHFISSVYIKSNHLFSEDVNMQIFLSIREYFNSTLSTKINGKNTIDFKIIDNFLNKNLNDAPIKRIGRYLILENVLPESKWHNAGIITSPSRGNKTILAIPFSCTNSELLDTLERIKNVLI